jgi:cell volume regulation protein A
VFATYPLLAGIDKSHLIFNLVFFISGTSVLLQGTTLSWVARKLGVAVPEHARRRVDPGFESQDRIRAERQEFLLQPGGRAVGKRIVELGLPATITLLSIQRNNLYIAPNGSTLLQPGDRVLMLAENSNALNKFVECGFTPIA